MLTFTNYIYQCVCRSVKPHNRLKLSETTYKLLFGSARRRTKHQFGSMAGWPHQRTCLKLTSSPLAGRQHYLLWASKWMDGSSLWQAPAAASAHSNHVQQQHTAVQGGRLPQRPPSSLQHRCVIIIIIIVNFSASFSGPVQRSTVIPPTLRSGYALELIHMCAGASACVCLPACL